MVFDQDHRDWEEEDRPDDARRFTTPGQYWQVNLTVDDPEEDVVAVMVYTDRFAEPGAGPLTVNDLHLSMFQFGVGSGGLLTYYGNYFGTDGYSLDPTGPIPFVPYDHVNTVEMIRVKEGELQSWGFWLTVRAGTISEKAVPGLDVAPVDLPNQDFALYVYNAEISSGG